MLLEDRKCSLLMHTAYCKDEILLKNDWKGNCMILVINIRSEGMKKWKKQTEIKTKNWKNEEQKNN